MKGLIRGIHHVTSIASDAIDNNRFFTEVLGLRRVKKTVNFDYPKVYHLYYGDEIGDAGTVMTYFPFEGRKRSQRGSGEVSSVAFSIPPGTKDFWQERLASHEVAGLETVSVLGQDRLRFEAPDGDAFDLVEVADDPRSPWTASVPSEQAIRGFYSACLHVNDKAPMDALLQDMGYSSIDSGGGITRYVIEDGSSANHLELLETDDPPHKQDAGSVHHIAFAVKNAAEQQQVRDALIARGHEVTEVRDRDYFLAIYFRSPGGILFEVATHEPGFDCDEDRSELGKNLCLPKQHAHLRDQLESVLPPIT